MNSKIFFLHMVWAFPLLILALKLLQKLKIGDFAKWKLRKDGFELFWVFQSVEPVRGILKIEHPALFGEDILE